MIVDCHVHVSACTPGHGSMSPTMLAGLAFRFMRWKFGIPGNDEATERTIEQLLTRTLDETTELDAAGPLRSPDRRPARTREGVDDAGQVHGARPDAHIGCRHARSGYKR